MDKQTIEDLIAKFNCDDIIKCQQARRSLVKLGHEAVPYLVEALGSRKHWVRWEAAKALSQIGDPAAILSLVKALTDKEFDVRWLAAEGLINIGKRVVEPILEALIDDPKSIWLREGVHHVLHDMDRGNWDGILRLVITALEDVEPSVEVPFAAKKALDTLTSQNH